MNSRQTMHSKRLQVKKKHHYVWANYLTRWGNGSNNVFYTTKKSKISEDSVFGIAFSDYFYKASNLDRWHIEVILGFSKKSPENLQKLHASLLRDFLKIQYAEENYLNNSIRSEIIERHFHALKCNMLEDLHGLHEKRARPILDALAAQDIDFLIDNRRMMDFMSFLGHQIARTKPFKDGVFKVLSRSTALEVQVAKAMEEAWWFLSYMYGMNIGSSLYLGRHDCRHALLINDTSVSFITSDQPVVNVHNSVSETKFEVPKHADFYFPISPRIAYVVCDSHRFNPGKNYVDELTVVELNGKVAAQAMLHIVGNSRDAILPFQKFIGQRARKYEG